MANVSRVRGAIPIRKLDGSPYMGLVTPYLVPAADGTALFIGDFVVSGGTAGASGLVVGGMDCSGMATAIQAAATNAFILGVVVGFLPNPSDLSIRHRVASTNRIALVCDDPDMIFEIQEDAGGATTALVDVGENADIVVGAGNATTGMSGMQLDSSTHTAATAQLRILRFVPRADNEVATANAKLEVAINEHAFKNTAGT